MTDRSEIERLAALRAKHDLGGKIIEMLPRQIRSETQATLVEDYTYLVAHLNGLGQYWYAVDREGILHTMHQDEKPEGWFVDFRVGLRHPDKVLTDEERAAAVYYLESALSAHKANPEIY